MSQTILLSSQGLFPDVCLSTWGFTVAYEQNGGPLVVQTRAIDGQLRSQFAVSLDMPQPYPRLCQVQRKTWIAYRAFRRGQESAVCREVLSGGLGEEQWLGATFGNNPVCLSPDGLVAWQERNKEGPINQVNGLRLDSGETLILRFETRPTGLAYLDGDHPVFTDDNRLSEPGMLNPVRSGALTVGEGPEAGLRAKIPPRFGEILGGECFVPRGADFGADSYAAVTWGPGVGATLVLFESEDIQPLPDTAQPIPLDQVEALSGELLVAWYEQNGTPESHGAPLPPGNAEIAIRNYPQGSVRPRPVLAMMDNYDFISPSFAVQLGSEGMHNDEGMRKLETLAAELHRQGIRPFVYWDDRRTPRPFNLPPGAVFAFMAYCGKNEPIQAFEADVRSALIEHSQRYEHVLMACQTHTTNDSLLDEPSRAIPSYIRLIKEFRESAGGKLVGVSIFNNSGRDTPDGKKGGLTANPQLRPHWTKAFSRCTVPQWLLKEDHVGTFPVRITVKTPHVKRSDPEGCDVAWDYDTDSPPVWGRLLICDAQGNVPKGFNPEWYEVTFKNGAYLRGQRIKPVLDGVWHVKGEFRNERGDTGTSISANTVTVTSSTEPPPFDLEALLDPANVRFVQGVATDYPKLSAADATDQVGHRMNKHYGYSGALIRMGRKARNNNPDNPNLNHDALTIRLDLNDNSKKKLIDIWINADDPGLRPTWDVRPAEEEPGNGYWWPPATPPLD